MSAQVHEVFRILCESADSGAYVAEIYDLDTILDEIITNREPPLLYVSSKTKQLEPHTLESLKNTVRYLWRRRCTEHRDAGNSVELFKKGTGTLDREYLVEIGYTPSNAVAAGRTLSPPMSSPPQTESEDMSTPSDATMNLFLQVGESLEVPTAANNNNTTLPRKRLIFDAPTTETSDQLALPRPSYPPMSSAHSQPPAAIASPLWEFSSDLERDERSFEQEQASDVHVEEIQRSIERISARIGYAVDTFCRSLIPDDGNSRQFVQNAPQELGTFYWVGLGKSSLAKRIAHVRYNTQVAPNDVLRCISAAAVVEYVFGQEPPTPWLDPEHLLAPLDSTVEHDLRCAWQSFGIDQESLARRICLSRANAINCTPFEIVKHSRKLADNFVQAIKPHLAAITPTKKMVESEARMKCWPLAVGDAFLEGFLLNQRIRATFPGAEWRFYGGEDVDPRTMQEYGLLPGQFSRPNGVVALTVFPGLSHGIEASRQQYFGMLS